MYISYYSDLKILKVQSMLPPLTNTTTKWRTSNVRIMNETKHDRNRGGRAIERDAHTFY